MKNKESLAEKIPEKKRSKESIFGTLLFAVLIVFTITSIVGVGFVAYTKWQMSRQESARPSIVALATEQEKNGEKTPDSIEGSEMTEEKQEPDTAAHTAQDEALVQLKATAISVLNGGAAKGSAALATDILKAAGYSKSVAGNATGDYVGVVVYHASGMEQAATIIKEVLVKKYPNTTIKAALPGNKETTVSSITVILGK